MFSNRSSSSISLATVTPSLVTVGPPKLLSMMTFRPVGPMVTATAFASFSTPWSILALACSSNNSCFATLSSPYDFEFKRSVGRPSLQTNDGRKTSRTKRINRSMRVSQEHRFRGESCTQRHRSQLRFHHTCRRSLRRRS